MAVNASDDAADDMAVIVVLVITLVVAVVYLVVLFVSGILGLIDQLAHPAARIEFNASVSITNAVPLYLFTYLTTPELRRGRRLKVALTGALTGMIVCALATAALAPGIDRPSSFEFAAAAYLLFAGCGLLPALVVARGYVFFDRDTRVAAASDHYVDTSQLSPETKRLIAKHAPALKAPPGWRPPALFGARDALTHHDLRRILSLEEEEARQLRDLHELHAANAHRAREDAHHTLLLGLSPKERALFEATLRADAEAVSGITAYKEERGAEIARLIGENHTLRAAAEAAAAREREFREALAQISATRDTLLESIASSERAHAAQQHELDWLWSEWRREGAPREPAAAAKCPPIVHLHPRRSSWSTAARATRGERT